MLSLIDFILNIASLLLFLNWRSVRVGAMPRAGVSIVSTLKRAGPPASRWFSLAGLAALLFVRAWFYYMIAPAFHWDPKIPLGPTTLVFRSDFLGRMMIFSLFGFIVTLLVFYFWLLVISCINRQIPDTDPQQKLVRLHLSQLEHLPWFLKLFLPWVVVAALWLLSNPLLFQLGMTPKIATSHLFAQSLLVGLAIFLSLKYLFIGFLLLYLLNSYVYLGEFPFWNFVNLTGRSLLRPFKALPLRVAKIDLTPIVSIAVIILLAELGRRGLALLFQRLF